MVTMKDSRDTRLKAVQPPEQETFIRIVTMKDSRDTRLKANGVLIVADPDTRGLQ